MTDITLLGHSAAHLTRDGHTLILDPGLFSDLARLPEAEAVLITHGHADHVVAPPLLNTAAEVWAPADVVTTLAQEGVPADRLHAVSPGDTFIAAGFEVTVLGGAHAEIYPGLPPAHNNAYLVDAAILHPGDALPTVPDAVTVRTLLLPVAAPWLKLAEAIDYARAHPGAAVLPIHDGILSDPGRQLTDSVLAAILGAAYSRPPAGATLTA